MIRARLMPDRTKAPSSRLLSHPRQAAILAFRERTVLPLDD